jgi:hypothetical protein
LVGGAEEKYKNLSLSNWCTEKIVKH